MAYPVGEILAQARFGAHGRFEGMRPRPDMRLYFFLTQPETASG